MTDPLEPAPEPANLRFLRILVTVLTAVMICGLVVIVGLFVIRFSSPAAPLLPAEITLPDGTRPQAVTLTRNWYGVVTDDGQEILIFSRKSGALIQTITVQQNF